ncbi:hypothetical protein KGO06_02890 [Patescibacteria group bacterium]|nr:hypothetical protein [Patescibacteria group bacterium]
MNRKNIRSVSSFAAYLILLQRTQYQLLSFLPKGIRRRLDPASKWYNFYLRAEAFVFHSRILRLLNADMDSEVSEIKRFFPERVGSILGIGSGVALEIALLARAFPKARVRLVDKEMVSQKIYYGLQSQGSYYNSWAAVREVAESVGVDSSGWLFTDVDVKNPIISVSTSEPYDIVVSFLSWGFHYPISVYSSIFAAIKLQGIVVLDIQPKEGWEQKIRTATGPNFEIVKIRERPNSVRVICRRFQ